MLYPGMVRFMLRLDDSVQHMEAQLLREEKASPLPPRIYRSTTSKIFVVLFLSFLFSNTPQSALVLVALSKVATPPTLPASLLRALYMQTYRGYSTGATPPRVKHRGIHRSFLKHFILQGKKRNTGQTALVQAEQTRNSHSASRLRVGYARSLPPCTSRFP